MSPYILLVMSPLRLDLGILSHGLSCSELRWSDIRLKADLAMQLVVPLPAFATADS